MQRACKEGFTNKQRLPMKRFVCNGLRGTVVAWGSNILGESNVPAGLSGVTAVAASTHFFHSLALKSDGTVVAWGSNSFGESSVPAGLRGVTAIAAGGYHSLAMKSDGTATSAGGTSSQSATIKRRRTL